MPLVSVCCNGRASEILSRGDSMDDGGCLSGCLATGAVFGVVVAAITGLLLIFVF